MQRLNRESNSSDDKKVQLSNQISRYEKEINMLDPLVESQLIKYKTKKATFVKVEDKYKEAQKYLESALNSRWDTQRKMTDDRSLLDRTESLIEEKIDVLSRLESRISEIERDKENQREAQKEIEDSKPNPIIKGFFEKAKKFWKGS